MTAKTGRFLGLPSDPRRPTWDRIAHDCWRPNDPRLFVPKAWGWGYSINLARLRPRRRR